MKHPCELCERDMVQEPCLERHASNYIGLYPYRFVCVECTTYEIASESKYQLVLSDRKSLPFIEGETLEEVLIIEDGPDTSYKIINDYYRLRSTIILLKRALTATIRIFEPKTLANYPLMKLTFNDDERMVSRVKTLIVFA